MLVWRAILMIMLAASSACVATAQADGERPRSASPSLRGLSAAEADELIDKLQDLQRRLRRGENLVFELLSGAPAFYPMTTVSPREAFLRMNFDEAGFIERVQTDNRLWQPYRLVFAPNGPGRTIWDVEVVLGINGDAERVTMIYRPPPPF